MPLTLTQDQINAYRDNGYLHLKNVYAAAFVKEMQTETDALREGRTEQRHVEGSMRIVFRPLMALIRRLWDNTPEIA